jgi:hypothetical protein
MSIPPLNPSPCANHPDVPSAAPCGSCGRPFCERCLVPFMAQRLCGPCKEARPAQAGGGPAQPTAPPTIVDHLLPAKNPPSLIAYYLGVFSLIPCAGNLLGPAAIIVGVIGLRAQKANPNLPGKGHAIAGIVLGSLTSLLYWGLVVAFVLSIMAAQH